jgi:hypothetical protein
MAADWHEPALIFAHPTLHQAEVQYHRDRVGAVSMLRNAHAPDDHAIPRAMNQLRKFLHACALQPGLLLQGRPIHRCGRAAQFLNAFAEILHEVRLGPTLLENHLQHAIDECDVAALRNGKPIIRNIRPEKRAAGSRRHPIARHSRLEVWIHHYDLRTELFRLV